ncbi:MAG TPA: cytochrome b/b6 domain-containing protein [Mucilaginibacter sp.]|nr:cytochrome b/b6 domain-containing protein [Mucilaginibacter sp.]
MSIIEPSKQNINKPQTTKKYTSALRLWHWGNFIIISGSLLTVAINSYILKGQTALKIVNDQLTQSGLNVTNEQARSVVGGLRDRVWDFHIYFGYCLASFLLFRIILEFFQPGDQKFFGHLKVLFRRYKVNKNPADNTRHDLVVRSLYALFYVLLLIMACTGLSLAFYQDDPSLKSLMHTVKDVHGFCMYPILIFICLHLAGVFLAERDRSKGIVSDMINGGK